MILQGIKVNDINIFEVEEAERSFGFNIPKNNNYVYNSFSDKESFRWIITPFEARVTQGDNIRNQAKVKPRKTQKRVEEKVTAKKLKRKREGGGKIKKWMLKMLKRIKKKSKFEIKSKFMIPLILGFLVAKSLFISIALKIIAFISAKGLMMGYFSTALSSILSLRSLFEYSHFYQNRKDDPKTQLEIIQVPSKNHEHIYKDYYRRSDSVCRHK